MDLMNENRSRNLKNQGRFLLEKTALDNPKFSNPKNLKHLNLNFERVFKKKKY